MSLSENGHKSDREDFLYSVLNVPKAASQNDIRERYRALSVIFHPDKQHDERTKATAAKKFLDIQKAYEVLSDPFLRVVYDILGDDGLKVAWPAEMRSKSTEEITDILKRTKRESTQRKLERIIRSKGSIVCGCNASSLFDGSKSKDLAQRISGVQVTNVSEFHRIKKDVSDKTTLGISTRVSREVASTVGLIGSGNIMGTIVHRISPRFEFEGTASLMYPRFLLMKATHRPDDYTTLSVETEVLPDFIFTVRPPVTVNLTRRLSRHSLTDGRLTARMGRNPRVSFNITTPIAFDLTRKRGPKKQAPSDKAGSISGLAVGTRYFSYAVTLAGLHSSVGANIIYTFTELALQARLSLEYGLTGLALMLRGSWENETSLVATTVGLNSQGVSMNIELSFLEQQFSLPIILSQEYNAALALCTAVIPSSAFVLAYHFILKPRRRAERAKILQKARLDADEDRSAVKRESEETLSLLRDTAQKHTRVERSKGGLVILEAFYGPSEEEDETKDLVSDVTVAVQALVHNSQLYIAGTRKNAIGFYDPAPSFAKALRVRYLFHDRLHYAEIPDYRPVVLPLEDHLVS